MKILITGAKGFVGKNLVAQLNNIKEGKKKESGITDDLTLYLFDLDTQESLLETYTQDCDFVIHLAGVNRPEKVEDFMSGNFGFTGLLLENLKKHNNKAPILITSSTQAALDNPYGKSKREGEKLIEAYGKENDVTTYIYRLPNVFGKWCRPNYNSAVATFCYNLARDLPIQVNDPSVVMHLVYVDDVVKSFIEKLKGDRKISEESFEGVLPVHTVLLGQIPKLIESFKESRKNLSVPLLSDPFEKALYSTYLSYLKEDDFSYPLKMNSDHRGSFTEIIKTGDRGQFSVNISKPGITKGNHWHHTKNEKFVVVSGTGVIRFRGIDSDAIIEYYVSGDKIEGVDIPPGYTHNIENLGESDLVTLMWCNESFDKEKPDTYYLEV